MPASATRMPLNTSSTGIACCSLADEVASPDTANLRRGSFTGPGDWVWLVSAHSRSRSSTRPICASRVVAAANACTLAASAADAAEPRLMASRRSRTQPLPRISGSAEATAVGMTGVSNARKNGLLVRLRLTAAVSLPTPTACASVVLPLLRVTVAVPLTTLPLPRLVTVLPAFSEMLATPFCARVNSSLAWLMPSWFRSCHRRTWEKALSSALKTRSPLLSTVRKASKPVLA